MTPRVPAPIISAFVRRQRRDLPSLEDHLLDDIGLTQSQADAEAKRPVWDVPAHWRR